MATLAILGSGRGSNCRAILQSIADGKLAAEVKAVVSDFADAPILQIAREFGARGIFLPPGPYRTRLAPEAESRLVEILQESAVDLVVLAGFMRVLKRPMLAAYPGRILNIHPSMLPKFPGLRAWEQAMAAKEKATGVTVHWVDEKIDHGQIVLQRAVPILPGDTVDSLHARIQLVEHELYPEAIALVSRAIPARTAPPSDRARATAPSPLAAMPSRKARHGPDQ